MDQQACECRRRRVDHKVVERKSALRSYGGINPALQNLDELLLHMLRWLYGLDADEHKNITGILVIYKAYTYEHIQVHVRDVNMLTSCA